jgi:hypothetical protein
MHGQRKIWSQITNKECIDIPMFCSFRLAVSNRLHNRFDTSYLVWTSQASSENCYNSMSRSFFLIELCSTHVTQQNSLSQEACPHLTVLCWQNPVACHKDRTFMRAAKSLLCDGHKYIQIYIYIHIYIYIYIFISHDAPGPWLYNFASLSVVSHIAACLDGCTVHQKLPAERSPVWQLAVHVTQWLNVMYDTGRQRN